MGNAEVTSEMIRRALRETGLAGRPMCVHSSLRSFGKIAGGADALIDAILAEGCTLVVPTFTYRFMLRSQPGMRPPRNGTAYGTEWDSQPSPALDWVYSPQIQEVAEGMGKFPAVVAARPGRVRGIHPICSFTAVGPLADTIIAEQKYDDVYGPLRTLSQLGGACVLMGVGLNRLTFLHYAEQLAGRNTFRRWANGPDGKPMMLECGGCSEGFERLRPALVEALGTIEVGKSLWTYMDAQAALQLATDAIRRDPAITHCGNPACERCRDAVAGGPILRELEKTN